MPFVFFQSKNTLVHISLAIGSKDCSSSKIPELERIISPFYHFNKLCTVTVKNGFGSRKFLTIITVRRILKWFPLNIWEILSSPVTSMSNNGSCCVRGSLNPFKCAFLSETQTRIHSVFEILLPVQSVSTNNSFIKNHHWNPNPN